MRDLRAMFDGYPNADEIVWVQEEPENMGAWDFIRPHLTEVSNGRTVRRVARPRSASPAEGSAARHALNQQALVNQAFADSKGQGKAPAARARREADERERAGVGPREQ
jgi:2-oxoglutarate dehydrogenase complex dehydrogenase (E1) component-like enzyme